MNINESTLTVIGGTYIEHCQDPYRYQLFGSGLRAAAAISLFGNIDFISCVGKNDLNNAVSFCKTFGVFPIFNTQVETIGFEYYHPLSKPDVFNLHENAKFNHYEVDRQNVLYFGLIEATFKVNANFLVYDPQNHKPFTDTGSIANHLALILNKNESYIISELSENTPLRQIGLHLMKAQNAEVVVIKNGSKGALLFDETGIFEIPVYKTKVVWPIGSGDIFSAAFAANWILKKKSAIEAAQIASRYAAHYCQLQELPLPNEPDHFEDLPIRECIRKIYLAGPFFNMSERWLINELKNILTDFGNEVFSPFHEIGLSHDSLESQAVSDIVIRDLDAIREADLVFAVLNGLDAGTIFEIGYAKSLGKNVIVLAENVSSNDLTMLVGSGCDIITDFSTAVYKASW
jgi:nucleoside 2-deoxyribosyltransferase